jgi:Tfp pilus assembly protein PilX
MAVFRRHHRGMALYVAVCATATIVTVLALGAMAVVLLERKQAVAINNRLCARANARSAVELALAALNSNSNWRSVYSNNVEPTPVSLGANGAGTLSWKLVDADGSLADADT